jgi:hypothetical protein
LIPQISPNPCNHYYWEYGEDNYMDFLARHGYIFALVNAHSAGELAAEEIEEEGEDSDVKEMKEVAKKMDDVGKKMDELIEICRNVFAAVVVAIAVMLYLAVAK